MKQNMGGLAGLSVHGALLYIIGICLLIGNVTESSQATTVFQQIASRFLLACWLIALVGAGLLEELVRIRKVLEAQDKRAREALERRGVL